jgi:protein-tyrosine phosphatase
MFRSVRLPDGVKGELFLHSMPGRYEEFDAAVCEIQNRKIDEVVCLATMEEISLKSPLYKNALQTKRHSWRQRMYSVPNFGAPSDKQDFLEFTRDLTRKLLSGKKLLIHCGGGIGRTGMLAVGLLMSLGVETDEARETVASAHSCPETTAQDRLLEWLALELQ